jgi:hypothetical protein
MDVITAKNLTVRKPSPDWIQQLRVSLAAFAGPGNPLIPAFYEETWQGRQAVHCIYSVGLTTLIDPKGLAGIDKPFCWRFLAGGHRALATAAGCWATHELHQSPPMIMATFHGPEMADTLSSTEQLNSLKELTDQPGTQYDLSVLRIPALYIEAFWVRCPKGNDLIVPYGLLLDSKGLIKAGAEGRLVKNKAYPVAEFLGIVSKAAKQRLAVHEALPAQPVASPRAKRKRG